MRLCKVSHMHIVPHAGAVRRGIIRAMQRQRRALARHRLQHKGDQMRLGGVLFAHLTLGIGTGDVEVAKDDMADPERRAKIGNHPLDRQL